MLKLIHVTILLHSFLLVIREKLNFAGTCSEYRQEDLITSTMRSLRFKLFSERLDSDSDSDSNTNWTRGEGGVGSGVVWYHTPSCAWLQAKLRTMWYNTPSHMSSGRAAIAYSTYHHRRCVENHRSIFGCTGGGSAHGRLLEDSTKWIIRWFLPATGHLFRECISSWCTSHARQVTASSHAAAAERSEETVAPTVHYEKPPAQCCPPPATLQT